jgi:hypothetical protein
MTTPLTRAFATLRKQGYFARQNFWCCQSCGWYAVPSGRADHAVFYSQQDKASMDATGVVYLSWSGSPEAIRQALEAQGLVVEHDSSPNTRFKVKVR